ncbi:MAG: ATP-dependent Clp protease ATP-binding subunit [Acidobacteria bacterium]|nr:ATP-dependent Clp protease ATP-binding subunit [Acidobacteriota bacterium]
MSTDSPHDPAPATDVADLVELLSQKVIGQPSALRFIVPYIEMYQAGLAPDGRPAGIFLLLGPTGTGKTRTVEALAEVLHGTDKHVLKINCGEFQSDHEVAKLIGAPPGYVGHRESPPLLTPERLAGAASTRSDLSLVLFDEIEKAAPALTTLLLGILDRATMRLGDSREVDFTKTLIFLTSNLGAREMMRELGPGMGFRQPAGARDVSDRLESIALGAVRRRFSPEFVNRIDVVVTYRPLDEDSLATIVTHHIDELQRHVSTRLGDRSFSIQVAPGAREFLQLRGTSQEYGARELRRVIHRFLTQPLAARVAASRSSSCRHRPVRRWSRQAETAFDACWWSTTTTASPSGCGSRSRRADSRCRRPRRVPRARRSRTRASTPPCSTTCCPTATALPSAARSRRASQSWR